MQRSEYDDVVYLYCRNDRKKRDYLVEFNMTGKIFSELV